jgi:hypothetical protein
MDDQEWRQLPKRQPLRDALALLAFRAGVVVEHLLVAEVIDALAHRGRSGRRAHRYGEIHERVERYGFVAASLAQQHAPQLPLEKVDDDRAVALQVSQPRLACYGLLVTFII